MHVTTASLSGLPVITLPPIVVKAYMLGDAECVRVWQDEAFPHMGKRWTVGLLHARRGRPRHLKNDRERLALCQMVDALREEYQATRPNVSTRGALKWAFYTAAERTGEPVKIVRKVYRQQREAAELHPT